MDIEAYLEGSMAASEREAFEKRLLSDAALREELEQYQSLKTDLDWYFAAKDVAAAEELRAQLEAKRRRWSRILLAALLVLLAGFAAFWFLTRQFHSPQRTPETPVLQKNTNPTIEPPVESVPTPPIQKIQAPNQPIAGTIRPRSGDLMRNLPPEEVSEATLAFFKQQWEGFVPAVPEVGVWAKPIRLLRNQQAGEVHVFLKKLPPNDTVAYLTAVADILLKRPSAAEDNLYPLSEKEAWKNEVRYLLGWCYLLRGETEAGSAAFRLLPPGFRDREMILREIN